MFEEQVWVLSLKLKSKTTQDSIDICVPKKKEMHTDLEQHEDK